MINVSTVKQHMFCPMKGYIQEHIDVEENEDYQLAIEIKKLKIDIKDLMQKNMRKLKKEMSIAEIEHILSENIDPHIESTTKSIISMDLDLTQNMIEDIIDNTYFEIKIASIKAKQAMHIANKDGYAIVDMFFPNCLYSYLVKDKRVGLIGICDKVEIIDGKYYPILLKSSNPPLKGVWDSDAIELVANAILLEEEFGTEVFVGFVDYEKIGDRRPVVMDVNLRKALFEVLDEIHEIIENKKLPQVKMSERKCGSCQYKNICFKE